MAGRERSRRADPDDWFAEGDRRAPIDWDGANGGVEPADWAEPPPSREPRSGPTIRLGTLLVAGAALVVVIVLVALALGGVFSGGGKNAATTNSTQQLTTGTPSTTPSATPTKPVGRTRAPTATLKPGDRGGQVKLLQRALAKLGYSTGAADGVYGPSTQAALERFQKRSSLTADGVFGAKTLQALKHALAAA